MAQSLFRARQISAVNGSAERTHISLATPSARCSSGMMPTCGVEACRSPYADCFMHRAVGLSAQTDTARCRGSASPIQRCRAQPLEQTEQGREPDQDAEGNIGGQLLTLGKWTLSLMMVIGTFYAVVVWGSGALALFLKDKIDFTRKDFVPYSERRRLEEEQQLSEQQQSTVKAPQVQQDAQSGQSSLLDLLPLPPFKS